MEQLGSHIGVAALLASPFCLFGASVAEHRNRPLLGKVLLFAPLVFLCVGFGIWSYARG